MRVKAIAVGTKMPTWVDVAVAEYCKRLPRELAFEFVQIPLAKRGKATSDVKNCQAECLALDKICPSGVRKVALDVGGKSLSTEKLATNLSDWQRDGRDVYFFIGGPDGLTREFVAQCDERLSLSRLTLPHPMVRVILAEQMYRAWSINAGHPYHR